MSNSQAEIFNAFRKNITNKISPYLSKFNFNIDNVIKEEQQWINANFTKDKTVISIGVSLHHLDYTDGITVLLKSKFGDKFLRNEVLKNSNKNIPIYSYNKELIDSEFDRIISDIKQHLENYFEY
ncbi:MAG: hypothetical protein IM600_17145 [Bacteroidetes bacterium]|jgi:hypothetical protein|nr:hypothetical protein [Bacteroidota bacterium]